MEKVLLSAAVLIGLAATDAGASAIVSSGAPVTGSGFYSAGSETFPFDNITDGRHGDTGSPGDWSFWLTRNGTLDHFIIDLGSTFLIDKFEIQNTHNRGHFDRRTNAFSIGLSTTGASFTTVLTSTLSLDNALPIETFDIGNALGRYVRFDVVSYVGAGGGLNELSVFADPVTAVPEPGTLALLGAGLAGLGFLRRRPRSASAM